MASETSNQKRKRGRLPDWSEASDRHDSRRRKHESVFSMNGQEEGQKHQKRGQPFKSQKGSDPHKEGTPMRRSGREKRSADAQPWWKTPTGANNSPARSELANQPRLKTAKPADATTKSLRKTRPERSTQEPAGPEAQGDSSYHKTLLMKEKERASPSQPQRHERINHKRVRRSTRERHSVDERPWWAVSGSSNAPDVPAAAKERIDHGKGKKKEPHKCLAEGHPELSPEAATHRSRKPHRKDHRPEHRVHRRRKDDEPTEDRRQAKSGERAIDGRKASPQGKEIDRGEPLEPNARESDSLAVRRGTNERGSGHEQPWWHPSVESRQKDSAAELRYEVSSSTTSLPQKRKRGHWSLHQDQDDGTASKLRDKPPILDAMASTRARADTGHELEIQAQSLPGSSSRKAKASAAQTRTRDPGRFSTRQPEDGQQDNEAGDDAEDVKAQKSSALGQIPHLVRCNRKISAAAQRKWVPLNSASIAAIANMMSEVSRPVLHRSRRREDRHTQAAKFILAKFSDKTIRSLARFLFPPPTLSSSSTDTTRGNPNSRGRGHEADLDLERTVDATRRLEDELAPLLHSIALLEREKEKEEKLLRMEYDHLRKLEKNARDEARTWRERGKRAHVLAPETKVGREENKHGDNHHELVLVKPLMVTTRDAGGDVEDDTEIQSLWWQTGSHMESMRANLEPVGRILSAMDEGAAALRNLLVRNLAPEEYTSVVLGRGAWDTTV